MNESFDTTQLKLWFEQARGGDVEARNRLFKAVCVRMERLARQMLAGHPGLGAYVEPEDVLQNSFIRLLRALETFHPESTGHFFHLAATLIRRELVDLARHFQGVRAPRNNQGNDLESHDAVINPAARNDAVDEIDRWSDFHLAVESLPPEEREVVSLAFYHGWTQVEVAELFQVSERTIRRWWESALKRLRAQPDEA